MKKDTEFYAHPLVLRALRESAGMSIDEVARKLKMSKEKVKAVEDGKASFTILHIKKLADIYRRPLAAFLMDSPPQLPFTLTDYRINRERRLTPQVYVAQRRAYYLASKVAELSGKKSQLPLFPDTLEAEELAHEFRKHLHMGPMTSRKAEDALTDYRKTLEETLLISIIEYPLKADDVRAFCLSSDISVVVLNEHDKPEIKLFSLFHETCHLLKRMNGICSIDTEKDDLEIERYCNSFSAEVLVPKDALKHDICNSMTFDRRIVSELSKSYAVSKQVIMLRLLTLGYIDKEQYDKFRLDFDVGKLKGQKFARRNWDRVFFNRIGYLAQQEVGRAYRKGEISLAEVIGVFDMKSKYAENLVT